MLAPFLSELAWGLSFSMALHCPEELVSPHYILGSRAHQVDHSTLKPGGGCRRGADTSDKSLAKWSYYAGVEGPVLS